MGKRRDARNIVTAFFHRFICATPRCAAARSTIYGAMSDWFSGNLFIYRANSVTIYPSVDLNKLSTPRIYSQYTLHECISVCTEKRKWIMMYYVRALTATVTVSTACSLARYDLLSARR